MKHSMLSKLVTSLAAIGLLCGMATSSASAAIFMAPESTLSLNISALPTLETTGGYANGGYATLTDNGSAHDLSDTASVWTDPGVFAGTSLLTGVNLITDLELIIDGNDAGNLTASFTTANNMGPGTICASGPCLGGEEIVRGSFVIFFSIEDPTNNKFTVNFDFEVPTTTTTTAAPGTGAIGKKAFGQWDIAGNALTLDAAPFVTGKVKFTGIKTNVVSMPGRGGVTGVGLTLKPASSEEVKTFTIGGGFKTTSTGSAALLTLTELTIAGTNSLSSAAAGGEVTLIAPLRVELPALGLGVLPGAVTKKFVFAAVPEPGTVLLLVSGAAGLVILGRRRMRK